MELTGSGRRPKAMMTSRETSPNRVRPQYMQRPRPPPTTTTIVLCRKAQIVYYLSRNGQLEHPHFMELPFLPSHHIRLKDVMERLTVLRGRGMPSLYSWSCKRSYKNGYVWNDLSENDVIYPADGAEYVLKGSRIIPAISERFQQLQVRERQPPGPLLIMQRTRDKEVMENDEEEDNAKVAGHIAVSGNKGGANGGDGYNPSRCNHGGSLDERPPNKTREYNPTEIPLADASPPSSSSSDKAAAAVDRRCEDGCDSEAEQAMQGRNSVFMQLIACGSMAVKGRSTPPSGMLKGGDGGGGSTPCGPIHGSMRKSGSLYKGVVSRTAAVEEKEYFSGSIVETLSMESSRATPEPVLKKSSSYGEERSSNLGIGEEEMGGGKSSLRVRGPPTSSRNNCPKDDLPLGIRVIYCD